MFNKCKEAKKKLEELEKEFDRVSTKLLVSEIAYKSVNREAIMYRGRVEELGKDRDLWKNKAIKRRNKINGLINVVASFGKTLG